MSFTSIEPATSRACTAPSWRCRGRTRRFSRRRRGSAADIVFLDVEDAVAPDDKAQARKNIVAGPERNRLGLEDHDGAHQRARYALHVSRRRRYRGGLPPSRHDSDPEGGRRRRRLCGRHAGDADRGRHAARSKRIGFEVLIETALGMANVEAIAQSSRRLEAMSFGVADYAASTRARTTVIGGVNRDSGVLTDKDAEGEREYFWAILARGPDPHDGGVSGLWVAPHRRTVRRLWDPDGFSTAANRVAVLGYEGNGRSIRLRSSLSTRYSHLAAAEVDKARRSWRPWRRRRGGEGPSRSMAA